MTKKIFFLTLILLFSVTVLTGCFETTTTEEPSDITEDEEITDVAEEETLYDIVTKNWDIENLSYTEKTIMDDQTMESKVYLKDENMRWESYSEGQLVILIKNDQEDAFYTYYPNENTAIKMDMVEMDEEDLPNNPIDMTDNIDSGCVNKGKEQINGKKCTLVECAYEDEDGEVNSKMWIWDEYGIVIKGVYTDIDGETITTTVDDISFDEIDDSIFELPEGVDLVDLMDGLGGLLDSLEGIGDLEF